MPRALKSQQTGRTVIEKRRAKQAKRKERAQERQRSETTKTG